MAVLLLAAAAGGFGVGWYFGYGAGYHRADTDITVTASSAGLGRNTWRPELCRVPDGVSGYPIGRRHARVTGALVLAHLRAGDLPVPARARFASVPTCRLRADWRTLAGPIPVAQIGGPQ